MAEFNYTLDVQVKGAEKVEDLQKNLDSLDDKQVKVSVETDDEDAKQTKELLDEIEETDATAKASVDSDTEQAEELLNTTAEIDGIDVTANADISSDTTGAEDVKNAIEEVDGSEGTGNANTKSDLTGVDEAEQKLNEFDGSTATGEANVDNTGANSEIDETGSLLSELASSKYLIEIGARIDTESIEWIEYVKEELATLPAILGGAVKDNSSLSEFFSETSENCEVGYTDIVRALNNGNVKIRGEIKKGLNDAFNIKFLDKPKMVLGNLNSLVSNTFKGIVGSITKGDIGGAISSITKGFGGIKDAFSSVYGASSIVTTLGSSFTFLATAVASATAIITPFANKAKSIAGASAKLGVSTDYFQAMSIACEKAGVSSDKLTSAMQRMYKNVENGSTKTRNAVESMGISFEEFQNASGDERMKMIAQNIGKVGTASQKSAVLQNIFGASGKDLANVLDSVAKNGGDVVDMYKDQISYTEEATQNAKEFKDEQDELSNKVDKVKSTLATSLMPLLTGFLDVATSGLTVLMPMIEKLGTVVTKTSEFIGSGLHIVAGWFDKLTENGKNAQETAGKVAEKMGHMSDETDKAGDSAKDTAGKVSDNTKAMEDNTEATSDNAEEWSSLAEEIYKTSEYYQKYKDQLGENTGIEAVDLAISDLGRLKEQYMTMYEQTGDTKWLDKIAEATANFVSGNQAVADELLRNGEVTKEQWQTTYGAISSYAEDIDKEIEETSGKEYHIGWKIDKKDWDKDAEEIEKDKEKISEPVTTETTADTEQAEADFKRYITMQEKWDNHIFSQKIKNNAKEKEDDVQDLIDTLNKIPKTKKTTYTITTIEEKIKRVKQEYVGKGQQKDTELGGGQAVATKRPQRFGTPTIVEVGEYQEEVILGTNIYEQALKNAMGSGVEQGAMMTANNLGNVASGVDSTLLHNDLMSILTTIRTMDTAGGNQVVNVINGKQVSSTTTGSKTETITTTLRNMKNKNAGVTTHDLQVVEALLREIL